MMWMGWGAEPPESRRRGGVVAILALVCAATGGPAKAADPVDDGLIDRPSAAAERVATRPAPKPARAGTSAVIENFPDQIDVPAGQSVIVRLRRPAQRVAIAEPEVADVVLVSPTEILINGKGRRFTAQSGEPVILEAQTSLIVWDKQGVPDVRALYVNRSRREQVELRVTVAELNRTAIEQQGFDFRFEAGEVVVTGRPGKIPILGNIGQIVGSEGIDNDRLTFAVLDRDNNFAAFIELLQRESMAKVLARPSLLSRSGEEAHFRSGGEQPIPLITSNQVAVQFKEFGTIVSFTPTFTDDGSIDLRVDAELSQPDFSNAPIVNGIRVPSFVSRQANTRVRLYQNQSLLIAGLLSDNEVEEEQKVPYLGDIPYLGALFRRTSFNHTRSELMILVQPRVVESNRSDVSVPLPTGRAPLTRSEVRTKPTPNPVTRPRLFGRAPADVPAEAGGPARDETDTDPE